ncbi:hypothetical protein WAI453_012435 [Rhynchosporium graminicola]
MPPIEYQAPNQEKILTHPNLHQLISPHFLPFHLHLQLLHPSSLVQFDPPPRLFSLPKYLIPVPNAIM